jgi:hypothetical protein
VPGVPLEQQQLWDVYTMRVLFQLPDGSWRAYEGEKTLTPIGAVPWAPCWRGLPHCVFGHDSKRGLQLAPHATGVDTACASGGALTALVLPPLRELRRSRSFARKLRARRPLTREDLQATLISVPSAQPPAPPRSGGGA